MCQFRKFRLMDFSFILLHTATALNPLSVGKAARKCFSLHGLQVC